MRVVYLLATIIIFWCGTRGTASELSLSRNARTFDNYQSSLMVKSMAHACLTLPEIADSLPCNPAWTPLASKPRFAMNGLISNGYSTLEKMRLIYAANLDEALVQTLFGQERTYQIEGAVNLGFISSFINAQYTPLSIKYYSVARNEANPDIEVNAIEEKSFVFQWGKQLTESLLIGAQLRTAQRQIIYKRFHLFELATESGKDILKPQKQSTLFIEPGLVYRMNHPWQPRLSLMLLNSGAISNPIDDLPQPLQMQGGLGVTLPIEISKVDCSLEYRELSANAKTIENFHLGTVINYGMMYLTGGLDYNGMSMGVLYGLEQMSAGIVYSTTQVPWKGRDFYASTIYMQTGWQL